MQRPLLICDLDETLIHSTVAPLAVAHDFTCWDYLVHKRPFVAEFLETCARHYELAVWTSATVDYAQCVADRLFVVRLPVFVWSRDRCTRRRDPETDTTYWLKNLDKVARAGHDLRRVLMVEDTPRNVERHYGNRIVVRPYRGDPDDRELRHLARYLERLAGESDVRRIEKRRWRQEIRAG